MEMGGSQGREHCRFRVSLQREQGIGVSYPEAWGSEQTKPRRTGRGELRIQERGESAEGEGVSRGEDGRGRGLA
jgi:hypothetical protein